MRLFIFVCGVAGIIWSLGGILNPNKNKPRDYKSLFERDSARAEKFYNLYLGCNGKIVRLNKGEINIQPDTINH